MRLLAWGFALCVAAVTPVSAQERAMIVLDASGSMWGQIDGKTKIEIARDTLGSVLGAVPTGNELGLIVYGHRRKGDCSDIELAVPAGKGTAGAISGFAQSISPKGKTPLSAAVKQAAQSLRFTEDKATVILVTDGLETCNNDPCALGRELEAAGVDFTAHVVGFGLSKEEGAQVSCLAKETGGQYLEASSADTLGKALEKTVVVQAEPKPEPKPTPPPEPAKPEFNLHATVSLAEGGPLLDDNEMFWSLRLIDANGEVAQKRAEQKYQPQFKASVPAGTYKLRAKIGKIDIVQDVTLSETEMKTIHVVLNAGILVVTAKRTAEGGAEKDARITVKNGDFTNGVYGQGQFYVPQGTVSVSGKLGRAAAEKDIVLAAGERIETDIIIGAGVVVASALYADGGPAVEGTSISYTVYESPADLNGKRKSITSVYGSTAMELGAGEYVIGARLGKAEALSQPFKVEAGQRTEVQLVLNAGVAAVSAPGGYRIRILGQKDIQGNRKELTSQYGEAFSVTLPAGAYLARVEYEGDKAPVEAEVVVKPGERAEVSLN